MCTGVRCQRKTVQYSDIPFLTELWVFVHVWILRLITNHPLNRWYQYTGCRKNDITPIYCLIKLRKKKRHHSISLTFFVSCLKLWQNRNTISRRLGDIMSWCLKETHSSSIRSSSGWIEDRKQANLNTP